MAATYSQTCELINFNNLAQFDLNVFLIINGDGLVSVQYYGKATLIDQLLFVFIQDVVQDDRRRMVRFKKLC